MAATNPTSSATSAGSSAAPANVASPFDGHEGNRHAGADEDHDRAGQGRAAGAAHRPGNLSESRRKEPERAVDAGGSCRDRAHPDEAAQLKSGLAALAEKQPKAEKQIGLTKIANSVAVNKPTNGRCNEAGRDAPADGKVAVTTRRRRRPLLRKPKLL